MLAYACLNLAAAQGNKNAVEGKDIVRPRMTADQIAPAQKLSASLGRSRCLGNLSVGIALRPGELRIAFGEAEDLATKLLELSPAMANDWPAFRRSVEENHLSALRR